MKVPIQNIYYMFCYAWGRFQGGPLVDVDVEDCPSLLDLFAKVLSVGTERLLRKGLDRGYRGQEEDLRTLRGRLDFNSFARRGGLQGRQDFPCRFDELDYNVVHNQILRTTIRNLVPVCSKENGLRADLRRIYRRMDGIDLIRVDRTAFRSVQLHRNNSMYLFLLQICDLIREMLLPNKGAEGDRKFYDILDDENAMALIFQSFVFNFYRQEQTEYAAKAEEIPWDFSEESVGDLSFLPKMQTDMVLRKQDRTVVLDTKYYKDIFAENRFGSEKFRSDNIYQLCAYLKNLEKNGEPDYSADGILLYPRNGPTVDISYPLLGHKVRFVTLDLSTHWTDIDKQLKSIVEVSIKKDALSS